MIKRTIYKMYFISIENIKIEIEDNIISLSDFISSIEEDNIDNEPIYIPYESSVIYNLAYYCKNFNISETMKTEDIFKLCVLADFLQINQLLEITMLKISKILSKSPEELLKEFNFDLSTLEEKEEFKQAHSWEYH